MCALLAGCAAGSANAASGGVACGTGPPPVTVLIWFHALPSGAVVTDFRTQTYRAGRCSLGIMVTKAARVTSGTEGA